MGDGFILMRLDSLESLPPAYSAVGAGQTDPFVQHQLGDHGSVILGWSQTVEHSRADFVRLHRDVGDEMGQDPEVFDSTFGCDPALLAERMAFLYTRNAPVSRLQDEHEPELVAVGTCTAWEVGGVGWIHSLAVGTNYQGRGLSKILLGAALNRLRDVRCCIVPPFSFSLRV